MVKAQAVLDRQQGLDVRRDPLAGRHDPFVELVAHELDERLPQRGERLLDALGDRRVRAERQPRIGVADEGGIVPERRVVPGERDDRSPRIRRVAACHLIRRPEVSEILHHEDEAVGARVVRAVVDRGGRDGRLLGEVGVEADFLLVVAVGDGNLALASCWTGSFTINEDG